MIDAIEWNETCPETESVFSEIQKIKHGFQTALRRPYAWAAQRWGAQPWRGTNLQEWVDACEA